MARGVNNNVYTVLSFIALLALITAVVVLWQAGSRLFGERYEPFKVVTPQAMVQPAHPLT